MHTARERLVIEDDEYGRLVVEREPAPDLVPYRAQPANDVGDDWRGCGAQRGAYEEAVRVPVEYIPPGSS